MSWKLKVYLSVAHTIKKCRSCMSLLEMHLQIMIRQSDFNSTLNWKNKNMLSFLKRSFLNIYTCKQTFVVLQHEIMYYIYKFHIKWHLKYAEFSKHCSSILWRQISRFSLFYSALLFSLVAIFFSLLFLLFGTKF